MVTIIIDGKQQKCKELIVEDWNNQCHKGFVYIFTDIPGKADKLMKIQK